MSNAMKEPKYCCEIIKDCVEDIRIPFDYDEEDTMYFLPFQYPNRNTRQGISFCPWCGIKLPMWTIKDE